MGRIIRGNIVRGNPVVYNRGVTHTDFNSSVFDQRQLKLPKETTDQQHHKQRDDLSTFRMILF